MTPPVELDVRTIERPATDLCVTRAHPGGAFHAYSDNHDNPSDAASWAVEDGDARIATGRAGYVAEVRMKRQMGRPLEVGQRVVNRYSHSEGVVLDFACQYAHPKAPPVYSYLIRWEDGQVQALSEGAFGGEHGFEVVD